MLCQLSYRGYRRDDVSLPTAGLEPAIFGLGGRRLIHWANKALHTLGRHVIQTAPGLPIWSPTIVLTGPEGA